jgi:hypothetical protein
VTHAAGVLEMSEFESFCLKICSVGNELLELNVNFQNHLDHSHTLYTHSSPLVVVVYGHTRKKSLRIQKYGHIRSTSKSSSINR